MNPQEQNELDDRLRAAFEPDAASVRRVVAAAMIARTAGGPRLRAAAALAALTLLVCVLVFVARRPGPEQPESVRLEHIGGVSVLEFPDGSTWMVTTEPARRGPQTHVNLILVGGEQP